MFTIWLGALMVLLKTSASSHLVDLFFIRTDNTSLYVYSPTPSVVCRRRIVMTLSSGVFLWSCLHLYIVRIVWTPWRTLFQTFLTSRLRGVLQNNIGFMIFLWRWKATAKKSTELGHSVAILFLVLWIILNLGYVNFPGSTFNFCDIDIFGWDFTWFTYHDRFCLSANNLVGCGLVIFNL